MYLPSFTEASSISGKKMIIKTNESLIHRNPSGRELGRYFIKGYMNHATENVIDTISDDEMVLVGDDFFLEDLINKTDMVRLQNIPSGDYKDVYNAISFFHLLVKDGNHSHKQTLIFTQEQLVVLKKMVQFSLSRLMVVMHQHTLG